MNCLSRTLPPSCSGGALSTGWGHYRRALAVYWQFRDRVIRLSGKKNPTVRDFIAVSGRGMVKEHPMFCGSPKQVADQMEEWFTAPACDGFVLAASSMPGAYDDVVRLLVPELQGGLFQKDYAGPTLS
jgi:alkanesulfonate monooxygenase SsuD/methylene tetrahydromethanopterin reductase-like flavin-dependent oxidoreductase (luciferase family)